MEKSLLEVAGSAFDWLCGGSGKKPKKGYTPYRASTTVVPEPEERAPASTEPPAPQAQSPNPFSDGSNQGGSQPASTPSPVNTSPYKKSSAKPQKDEADEMAPLETMQCSMGHALRVFRENTPQGCPAVFYDIWDAVENYMKEGRISEKEAMKAVSCDLENGQLTMRPARLNLRGEATMPLPDKKPASPSNAATAEEEFKLRKAEIEHEIGALYFDLYNLERAEANRRSGKEKPPAQPAAAPTQEPNATSAPTSEPEPPAAQVPPQGEAEVPAPTSQPEAEPAPKPTPAPAQESESGDDIEDIFKTGLPPKEAAPAEPAAPAPQPEPPAEPVPAEGPVGPVVPPVQEVPPQTISPEMLSMAAAILAQVIQSQGVSINPGTTAPAPSQAPQQVTSQGKPIGGGLRF